MKLLEINNCNYGSTGNIMLQIADILREQGSNAVVAYSLGKTTGETKNEIIIGNDFSKKVHIKLAYWTGFNGCFSIIDTWRFIHKVKRYKPDVLHLHNLHNCYINLPMLFSYIKRNHLKVIWTLHDCWSFTGQCPHFTMVKCNKWINGCHNCPQIYIYPAAKIDQTKIMWKLKKKWFTNVSDMTIVTPSQWLADLVKKSYLKDYPIKVIHNGIDLNVFKPTDSDFRQKYNLKDKFILLGVAFVWEKRKGVDVFIELAKRLDERFKIVLVGTNEDFDKQLPANIISVHKTDNQQELAELYSAADLFINPTREEVLGLVNIEALACGTPVLTFRTGGSPEVPDNRTGYVVDVDDIDELEKQIIRICTEKVFHKEDCLTRARNFDKELKFKEYLELYK